MVCLCVCVVCNGVMCDGVLVCCVCVMVHVCMIACLHVVWWCYMCLCMCDGVYVCVMVWWCDSLHWIGTPGVGDLSPSSSAGFLGSAPSSPNVSVTTVCSVSDSYGARSSMREERMEEEGRGRRGGERNRGRKQMSLFQGPRYFDQCGPASEKVGLL